VPSIHPLLDEDIKRAIERAASHHLGRSWVSTSFTDLNDRASHPCGIFHGGPFSAFAKLGIEVDAAAQFTSELRGLALVRQRAGIATPTPAERGMQGDQGVAEGVGRHGPPAGRLATGRVTHRAATTWRTRRSRVGPRPRSAERQV
jgi:hypothetical protein